MASMDHSALQFNGFYTELAVTLLEGFITQIGL